MKQRAWSWSFLQKRDSNSRPKPGLWGLQLRLHTPGMMVWITLFTAQFEAHDNTVELFIFIHITSHSLVAVFIPIFKLHHAHMDPFPCHGKNGKQEMPYLR